MLTSTLLLDALLPVCCLLLAAPGPAGDLFDGSLLLQDTGAEMWEVDKPGRKMMVVWGTDVDQFDPETQVTHCTAERALMRQWRCTA
jgi:hypothetical protein